MSDKGILLSPKHGVNPSLEQCFVCLQDMGVILFGRLKGDAEAPRKVCLGSNSEPCPKCQELMKQGVILISVDEAKTKDRSNPYRTGGFVVVRDKFIRRVFRPKKVVEDVLRRRLAFVPDDAWDLLGLPRGEIGEKPEEPEDRHEQDSPDGG
jgi:CRISPR/Cas system-associated protein Cas10 (large subunit of type III CRISPR-Cas system)